MERCHKRAMELWQQNYAMSAELQITIPYHTKRCFEVLQLAEMA